MAPVIQGLTSSFPRRTPVPVISVAPGPFSGGGADPTLKLLKATEAAIGDQLGGMIFQRAYGKVMDEWAGDFQVSRSPLDLVGQWAQLSFAGAGGSSSYQFLGRVTNEERIIHGTGPTTGPTGWQKWTAVSPFQLLDKSTIHTALFDTGDVNAVQNDTAQSFNVRDSNGLLRGNRSPNIVGESHVFGGEELWTRREALAYVLREEFTGQDFGGYAWSVAGDTGLLDVAADAVEIGSSQTVGGAVRSMISKQFGLDFKVRVAAGGFELVVFSLAVETSTYQGLTLPRNTRRITIAVGDRLEIPATQFIRSIDQRYSRIIVRGARVISCFTLSFSDGTLVKKWAPGDETDYLAGTTIASDPPNEHDEFRDFAQYSRVFSLFGAPDDFEPLDVLASPEFTSEGVVSGFAADHQNTVRSTLPFIPLRENVDYSTTVPTDNSPGAHTADFLDPIALLLDPVTGRYVRAEAAGISVQPSSTDWGARLVGSPNHLLALNHFAGANPTEVQPRFDYETLLLTVAVQLDTRLSVEVTRQGGDGTSLELEVPGAELWVLGAGSVFGTNPASGQPLTRTGGGLLLRSDRDGILPIMAAGQARYFKERARAQLNIVGHQPWSGFIGDMIHTVQTGGANLDLAAPITSVVYQGGKSPRTIVRAGYSR